MRKQITEKSAGTNSIIYDVNPAEETNQTVDTERDMTPVRMIFFWHERVEAN